MIDVVNISPNSIVVPQEHRVVDPVLAQVLAEDIVEKGQLSPIEVLALEDGTYRLIFGAHRLAAIQQLGRTEIAATVHNIGSFADESAIKLRTISENMVRRELSVLDRAVDIATWCEIYRETRTHIKPGRKPKELSTAAVPNSLEEQQRVQLVDKFTKSFSEAAQLAFGISRGAVFEFLRIAAIPEDLRAKISLLPLANQYRELVMLANEPANRQEQIITIILDDENHVSSVSDAIAVLDRHPPAQKEERWQKVSASFAQMKQSEQFRFFDLHQDAIEQWLADRNGINTEKEVA